MKLLNGDSIPIAIVVYSSISFKRHSICNILIYMQYNVIIYTLDHSWIDYDTTILLINTTNKWPQRHTNTPRLPLQYHPQYHPNTTRYHPGDCLNQLEYLSFNLNWSTSFKSLLTNSKTGSMRAHSPLALSPIKYV